MKPNYERSYTLDEWQWRDDGRTVEALIVPYLQPTEVTEPDGNGGYVTYREQFLRHSLMAQSTYYKRKGSAAEVTLLMEHNERDFAARIGFAKSLDDAEDGAYGTFRLYDGNDYPKVRSMLDESHTGLSVSFRDTAEPRIRDGITSRTQVFINHVAATPVPCYDTARILAIRETPDHVRDAQVSLTPKLDEIREWLRSAAQV